MTVSHKKPHQELNALPTIGALPERARTAPGIPQRTEAVPTIPAGTAMFHTSSPPATSGYSISSSRKGGCELKHESASG